MDAPMRKKPPVKTAQDELREAEEAERAAREAAQGAEEPSFASALQARQPDGVAPAGDTSEGQNGAALQPEGALGHPTLKTFCCCVAACPCPSLPPCCCASWQPQRLPG